MKSTLKIELDSYEKIMNLIKVHIAENIAVRKKLTGDKDDERRRVVLNESYDKLQNKLINLQISLSELQKQQEYQQQQLEKSFQEHNIDDKEQAGFDFDVETINFLNEDNWKLTSCDRNLAESLLTCFPSGTFLIRPSKTKENSFALSVVANSRVRHCLIDRNEEEKYYFHPPGPNRQTYSTLCDLVMDYRTKSLIVHNPELDTNLIFPVLSQLKKSNKGSGSNH